MRTAATRSDRYVDPATDGSQRTYATFNHLAGLLSALDGIGFLGLFGALIMWRIKARESLFLDDHGREAVNFQISLLIYAIVGSLLTFGLMIFVVIVLRLIGCIRGAVAASNGEYYRYPMCIRFLKGPADA